jgi:hypothetical protein
MFPLPGELSMARRAISLIGSFIALPNALIAQTAGPTPADVAAGLSSNRTSVQQNAYWTTVKGKDVSWTIQVIEVVPGWLSGYYVRGSASASLAVSCEIDDGGPATKGMVAMINIGDRVACSGKLADPMMTMFGSAAVTIKNGRISR